MVYELYVSAQASLLQKPETGMGYQIIEAKYGTLERRQYVVYNSEVAIDLDSNFLDYKTKLFSNRVIRHVTTRGLQKFDAIDDLNLLPIETASISVLSKNQAPKFISFSAVEKNKKKRHSGTTGALGSRVEFANGQDIFVRLSAFEDDKRIDFDEKKLKTGSYTTTDQDYKDCLSEKDNPVDRYALPNDEEIKWSFYIKPVTMDTLQRGVVQPAFDHAGGGVESYFANGTYKETYLEKREYGK